MSRCRAVWFGVCLVLAGCGAPTCADVLDRLRGTCEVSSLPPAEPFCDRRDANCWTECWNQLSCEEAREAFGEGRSPMEVSLCIDRCLWTFSCGDGETIPGGLRCDEVLDCANGADEDGCR